MAYLIITAHGQEFDRRELTGAVCIGRSGECDIAIHDALLSRLHCRLEPITETGKDGKRRPRWRVRDLGSRNGTHVNWKKIGEQTLCGGDQLRVGRTSIAFEAGEFVAAEKRLDAKPTAARRVRPADPHEALMGTVSDFVYAERDAAAEEYDANPSSPAPPGIVAGGNTEAAGAEAEPETLHSSIATAVAAVRRRARPQPRPVGLHLPVYRSVEDVSLQADPAHLPLLEPLPSARPRRQARGIVSLMLIGAAVCAATAAVLLCGWALTN